MEVTPVSYDELTITERPKLTSAEIRDRVYDRILKVVRTAAGFEGKWKDSN